LKYHQGLYKPKNPIKYEGDSSNIVYRSSWELKFFNWADQNSSVIRWSSEEIIVPYFCPTDNKYHRYFPDAKISVRTKTGVVKTYIIEIKPFAETIEPVARQGKSKKRLLQEVLTWTKNQAKWKAAIEYAADRGWEFKILTEKDLNI